MAADDVSVDDKVKRTRDLLSSFYSQDASQIHSAPANSTSRFATLDTINTTSFDADQYMNLLVHKSNLEGLLQRHVEMAAEIKNLDTDLQMLVYENYNKFISATDTIKRMKNNIVGMEVNMEQLLDKIMSVQSKSDGVNTLLFEKREHIEKLHRTRNLLRKVQFIYDLPTTLQKCIKSEAYSDAVRFYTGAMPIFKAYGDSSFKDCKKASEEVMSVIINKLEDKVSSDSESIQARAEAVMLLKQLDFPVEKLESKLLEKLEQFLEELDLSKDTSVDSANPHESVNEGIESDSIPPRPEVPTREFVEAVHAYHVIFPDSEQHLVKLMHDLTTRHFEAAKQQIQEQISSAKLSNRLRFIWTDVLLIDEVLPEAGLQDFAFEAARDVLKQYVTSLFSYLLHEISDALLQIQKDNIGEEYPLRAALEASKNVLIQGSTKILSDIRYLLDEDLGLILKLRGMIIGWVQEGFQTFFKQLNGQLLLLSGKNVPTDKAPSGLVLVISQLSMFIERDAISRIIEEIGSSLLGGSYDYGGSAFVPAEIRHTFRSAGEKFLQRYISMRTQRISVLLRKRLTTPNWIKHKEPREVHMFVDLFLQELGAVGSEVKQILPQGLTRRHSRTESNGSTSSSRSNPLRDNRSNTNRARSQLLETHLAKLFKQKMEIFTKVEHTQESVVMTIVKRCLKSLQEFVRLHTFNRSGFQQIQLDMQYLRITLKDNAEDEAAVEFLLDEVIVAAAERCVDPSPLEPAILDRIVQAKLAKTMDQEPATS
ncbi:putative vacuolar protein sorting-associated protein [Helianthus annuus]|uniref:Vacuolar protein sorting-associated protein 51 homolog n=1 Tax=Helianthus annuus TaxID=4232 RepID=A0A251S4A1_HELAN|nr:vacuolar protein sorting-associated protein 51 homolog [Helianthus annuus]KAF5811040.1 putative vacuolar protein sorting-associated protein [Helianthus annuus]KAJ0589819.1 putative vacuolar protein sorting-associated protein [Helianthus annuus]KAJ0597728.1 putative vacuolar protein sorting-associated protein [Helianthus annuus]KAJ0758371.1 putative vacuolar protein sorting-associated protein [Helianthus annuus]KAJ0762030.1 putative vacuolar protein sorting-associated protein [Helianthus ann